MAGQDRALTWGVHHSVSQDSTTSPTTTSEPTTSVPETTAEPTTERTTTSASRTSSVPSGARSVRMPKLTGSAFSCRRNCHSSDYAHDW